MKKHLFGIIAAITMIIGLSSCSDLFDNDYDMYFNNLSLYTVTGWGAIDIKTGEVYQPSNDSMKIVIPGEEEGPVGIPKDSIVYFAFKLNGSSTQYNSQENYKIDDDFTFTLYNDLKFTTTYRSAEEVSELPDVIYGKTSDGQTIEFIASDENWLD